MNLDNLAAQVAKNKSMIERQNAIEKKVAVLESNFEQMRKAA